MDRRQKKWKKEVNKGIKLYEKRFHNEYDYYGKLSKRGHLFYEEEKPKNGCLEFFIGLIKFIFALTAIAILFFIIYLYMTY